MYIKAEELIEKTDLVFTRNFGELQAIVVGDDHDRKVLFVNCSGTTKLKCDVDSKFEIFTDDEGEDYLLFETRVYSYKLYPIKRTFIKLKD